MKINNMYIYKTTNLITNKIYIGQHIITEKNKNKKYFGSGKLLKEKLKEYGIENFKCEIIEYCKDINELNNREIYWIEKLNSTNLEIGYNISGGGQQCVPTDEFIKRCKEIRNNISEENKKIWYKKISETMIKNEISKGENNPMYGVEYTNERKEKYKKTRKKNYYKQKYKTKEHRENMSKITKGKNNPNYNNKWNDKQKEKLSNYLIKNEIHKGTNNSSYGKFGKNSYGYKKIQDDIINNIINDYKNNFLCIRKLSKKYNISERKVKETIINNNLEIKTIYISNENKEKIKNMYINENLTIYKISKITGLDHRQISKILNENDIKIINGSTQNYNKRKGDK